MSLILSGLGLERVSRDALVVLYNGLSPELERLEEAWSGMDEELAEVLGDPELAPCSLEKVVKWFVGHRASAISEPKESYPIVTTMAYQLSPSPALEIDQAYEGLVTLSVEGFVKGSTQSMVNRRVQRTAEAINNVMVSSTLNGSVHVVPFPDVLIGDEEDRTVGTAAEGSFSDGTGEVWWWQGFRLQYRLPTLHALDERQVAHGMPPDGIDRLTVKIGG